ncbi:MAG: transcriptional repressor [Chitinophagales bacterium]|nr:transcriptional repressor [Chitinophagales bacterium]
MKAEYYLCDMMEKQNIQDLLSAHGIRKTTFRVELLEVFIESKYGLSFKDIKDKVISTKDKVTIYRALDAFLEKGLIHKVPATSNISKYALCPEECSEETHKHDHAHFICNQCGNTFCMDEVELPVFKNIKGYEIKKSKLTLEGDCPDCISGTDQ